MKIIVSAATTSDGYLDGCSPERLILSGEEDWKEVHALRASCDAILVGAGTIRKDNPSLVIRDENLRTKRRSEGKSADITKVAVSGSGNIPPEARFFTEAPGARKIVFVKAGADTERLKKLATVIALPEITAAAIAGQLSRLGIGKLMVEGGAEILKMFFNEGMADEFRLAVHPASLAELSGSPDICNAPRLPCFGDLPFEKYAGKHSHMAGHMNVIHYTINQGTKDLEYLQRAIDLSSLCAPTMTAYRVGCVIITDDGDIFEGYTHESAPHNHAEEEAILKAESAGADLSGSTVYTSMEPCSTRRSKPVSCCELILRNKMKRVVYAYAEPDHFVHCNSTGILRDAGVEVEVPEGFAEQVIEINSHILGSAKKTSSGE